MVHMGELRLREMEKQFIQQTLAAHDGMPTIVMWHRPRYSRGEHGNQMDAGVTMLWETSTADRDVRLAIWGHDHNFEQATRTGLGGQDVTTIVAGTGGAEALCAHPGCADLPVKSMRDAYFPWVQGLHILLDYLIDQDEDSLAHAWFFVPRILHPQSLVLLETAGGWQILPSADIERLASASPRAQRRAA